MVVASEREGNVLRGGDANRFSPCGSARDGRATRGRVARRSGAHLSTRRTIGSTVSDGISGAGVNDLASRRVCKGTKQCRVAASSSELSRIVNSHGGSDRSRCDGNGRRWSGRRGRRSGRRYGRHRRRRRNLIGVNGAASRGEAAFSSGIHTARDVPGVGRILDERPRVAIETVCVVALETVWQTHARRAIDHVPVRTIGLARVNVRSHVGGSGRIRAVRAAARSEPQVCAYNRHIDWRRGRARGNRGGDGGSNRGWSGDGSGRRRNGRRGSGRGRSRACRWRMYGCCNGGRCGDRRSDRSARGRDRASVARDLNVSRDTERRLLRGCPTSRCIVCYRFHCQDSRNARVD